MSILTDTDLRRIICTNEAELTDEKLLIQHFDEDCLTPMGYDLRVGCFYTKYATQPNIVTINEGENIIIKPRNAALIATLEQIKMPKDGSISALILSKVSQVAKGLSHISTKVDPGWADGELLIPIQNVSRNNISLTQGEKLCTIVFFKNESVPTLKYSPRSSGSKLVKLLTQNNRESLWKDLQLALVPILIIGVPSIIGYLYFGNTTGSSVTVAIAIGIERATSGIVARLIEKR